MNWQKVIEVLREGADAKDALMKGMVEKGLARSEAGMEAIITQVGLLRCIADALEIGIKDEGGSND